MGACKSSLGGSKSSKRGVAPETQPAASRPDSDSSGHSANDRKGRGSSTSSYRELSNLEKRVQDAMKLIVNHTKSGSKNSTPGLNSKSFNRIVLKFPILREAFKTIRSVFERFDLDGNGKIDRNELKSALASLGAAVSDDLVQEMFDEADMKYNEALSFREFLLALCIGSILKLFPIMQVAARQEQGTSKISKELSEGNIEAEDSTTSEGALYETPRDHSAPIENKDVMLLGEAQKMIYALRLVIEAYILFDEDQDGYIQYEEVIKTIREQSPGMERPHESNSSATGLLSEDRWNELDWDKDGRITFKEFLFAFYNWVGVEEDDEDEDDEESRSLRESVRQNTQMNASSTDMEKEKTSS
eukprot:gb/GECG01007548.1/.p1 GENE.gb/GECG01007548.1/~~gb/GECG01007548.1/.p1  ORF type:complete len:359 (+),score=67.56 gb/GECG01007548.1/:1-1077(+)